MKRFILVALATLCLTVPAIAQPNQSGAKAPKYGIAVVDINWVFKNHPQFRETLEGMKGEVAGIESQLKQSAQSLMQLEKKRNSFKAGTAEFKQADEQLARMKADFELNKQKLQKGFLEKEAQAYFAAYQQVQGEINRYAKHYNIGIVFRFSGDKPDPAVRQSILAGINRPVQYQDQIDITPDIEALVKARYPAKNPAAAPAATAPGQPAGTATRPGARPNF